MGVQGKIAMAGCFYSLLIWGWLLQSAQQLGGMLTVLKSYCKEDFGAGISLLLRYLWPHVPTEKAKHILCSRWVSLLLLLHQFQYQFFQFCKCVDTKVQGVNAVGKHRLLLADKNTTGIAVWVCPLSSPFYFLTAPTWIIVSLLWWPHSCCVELLAALRKKIL